MYKEGCFNMNNRLEKIPVPFEDFKNKLDNYPKILFSGIFGSGKTTFLNDFFKENKEYKKIHIYPVNYSIASNKDVFELIKYDILFQLIGEISKEDFLKLDIPYQLTLWSYLINNNDLGLKTNFFASFMNFAGGLGRGFLKVYEQLKFLKEGFENYHANIQKDDFRSIEEYLEKSTKEEGHIYEEDFFTELIRNLLKKLDAKTVLVIDDLDRLDPEHIFRVLNIFSSHLDFRGVENDNKFDFNKVVLVCDYKNIENIFHHRYGISTDFSGYIDKFYSTIYWHDTSSLIKSIVGKYLEGINTGLDHNFFEYGPKIGGHIRYVLEELIGYNLINFRELLQYDKKYDLNSSQKAKIEKNLKSDSILKSNIFNADVLIHFLLDFFNNKSSLFKKIRLAKEIEVTKGYDRFDEDGKDKLSELVLFLNHSEIAYSNFRMNENETIELCYKNYIFNCYLYRSRKNREVNIECKEITEDNELISADKIHYFPVLEDAINVYLDFIK